jgi:hypothetical protein
MEATLAKAEVKGGIFRGFYETTRWDVSLDGEVIGQVWRGHDGRRVCWMVESPVLPHSLPNSAVVAGYGRTTKIGAVQEVVDWHLNRERSFRSGDVWLHCFQSREAFNVVETKYLAEHDDGERCRWIFTTHVKERKPHLGVRSEVGWYASASRGSRTLLVDCCADEKEAVELILAEAFQPPAADEKRPSPMPPVRLYGSLAKDGGATARP